MGRGKENKNKRKEKNNEKKKRKRKRKGKKKRKKGQDVIFVSSITCFTLEENLKKIPILQNSLESFLGIETSSMEKWDEVRERTETRTLVAGRSRTPN